MVIKMRKRISEQNKFPEFSPYLEYKKLNDLFCDKYAFGQIDEITSSKILPSMSYYDCVNMMFLTWNLRGSFTSLKEMLIALQITQDDFDEQPTEDRLLDYIQFIINAVYFIDVQIKPDYPIYKATDIFKNAILDNSRLILDKLCAKLETVGNEFFVTYKDDIAEAVLLEHKDLEASITDYLKIDNRGDIVRKGEILCTLAKKLEPYEKRLSNTEFKSLC